MKSHLEDLLSPPEIASWNSGLWFVIIILLILSGLLFWMFLRWKKHQNTPSSIAKRRLHNLIQLHTNMPEETQSIAIKLASLLCEGLGVNHLDQYLPSKLREWNTFQIKLNIACYSTQSRIDMQSLFADAKVWLEYE